VPARARPPASWRSCPAGSGTSPWRHRHVDVYLAALDWLRPEADVVVDTVALDAEAAAALVHSAVSDRL